MLFTEAGVLENKDFLKSIPTAFIKKWDIFIAMCRSKDAICVWFFGVYINMIIPRKVRVEMYAKNFLNRYLLNVN